MALEMVTRKNYQSLMLKLGILTEEQLDYAKRKLASRPVISGNQDLDFIDLLIEEGLAIRDQLIPVLEYSRGINYTDLASCDIDSSAVKLISESMAKKYNCISIAASSNLLHLVMGNPLDLIAKEDIRLYTSLELKVTWSFYSDVKRAVASYYVSSEISEQAVEELQLQDFEVGRGREEEDEEVTRSPVVRLLNSVFSQAVQMRASDIHIEPNASAVGIRFRVDGDLKEIMTTPKSSQAPLIARVKIMSSLDIAEKRLPQDGRIEIKVENRPIDFRVSILPTVYGEKIVLRILDKASVLVTKDKLGFTPHNIARFNKIIKAPEGIILLSGPTGSGKTTTLYAVLAELNKPTINVITVEDPVEYRLEGINQVQVNTKAGLTFANGLRSILRQDPDIVMIGEIRDSETAEIATRAAITGHVVLSTIHTNDTISTVYRLIDMGVELYLVASALIGVAAQRLVKRLCRNCSYERQTKPEEQAVMKLDKPAMISDTKGCNSCGGTGYSGRIAIHEVLAVDNELRSMIIQGKTAVEVKTAARKKGMKTLQESCAELVLSGITSVEEMVRVTYSIDD